MAVHAGALVELRQTGGQVGGVALFAGHLFQTAGHLAQSLGPAGGGVSQNGHVVAHVAEVLSDGDAGVDGGLAGGHRHVGGVGDQHGALHQRLAVAGVLQLGELHQNVGHLVAALAAADVDDDVHVRPLGQLVLHHGLAGAEGAGDGGGAALGDGEERVDDALAAVHGAAGHILAGVGPGNTHRPALDHGQIVELALLVPDGGDDLVHGVQAAADEDHLALKSVGHHDLVQDGAGLLDGAQHVAGGELVAHLGHGHEVPLLFPVQGLDVGAAGDAVAGEGAHLGQGALDAVIDIVQHTGSKLHGHGHTGGFHHGAGSQARGLLVDLDGSLVAGHIQDLADQALRAHAHHVGDVGVRQTLGHDKRAGYFGNSSAHFIILSILAPLPKGGCQPPG